MNPTMQAELAGCRVLVVEDSYFIADEISHLLAAHGAHVVGPVACVADSRQLLQNATIDCAVLDVNVRGGQVFPLARELRRAGTPTIFATGYGENFAPEEFRDAVWLEKPVNLAALIDAIKTSRLSDAARQLHPE